MKLQKEVLISIASNWHPISLATQLEKEAEKWHKKGWYFKQAIPDQLLSNVCLCFEKEIHPNEEN